MSYREAQHTTWLLRTPAKRGIIHGGGGVRYAAERPIRLRGLAAGPSRLPSGFDGEGSAALTGSDAGKLSIKPTSSFAWASRSAKAASRGSAACLSCAAGLNFPAMSHLHGKDNVSAHRTFPNGARNATQAVQLAVSHMAKAAVDF